MDAPSPPRKQALKHALLAAGCKRLGCVLIELPKFLRPTCEEGGYESQRRELHKATSEN